MRRDRPVRCAQRSSRLRTSEAIDLVVIGPEAPLVAGVADALRAQRHRGVRPECRRGRSSKARRASPRICAAPTAFRPPVMSASNVPTSARRARRLRPSGGDQGRRPRRGKGVTVAMTRAEAEAAIDAAGDGPLVIEEFLDGEEASLFALVDGETARAARLGAGSQARRRRRHRPEYRRHGRLCAGARADRRARSSGRWTRSSGRLRARWPPPERRSAACSMPG